jgi:alanine racemase
MLYGSSPFSDLHRDSHQLKAAMTLNAPIIAIHTLKKGDKIGYAASFECPKDMRVAVIACGYADGYPRHAPSGTPVWIKNQAFELVGRVSMDMIIVDITKADNNAIKVSNLAELWGKNLSVDEIALSAETIGYELLCNVGNNCTILGT